MNIPLKIGIDIDNVIADSYTSYLEKFNKKFETKIEYEEINDFYYLEKHSGIKREKAEIFLETLMRDDDYQVSFAPYNEAIEVIKKWIKRGFSIHYITLRPTYMKNSTDKWLRKHGFWGTSATLDLYDEKEKYESDASYKRSVVEKLGIDIFIEDAKEIAETLKIPVLLLDRPWNRGKLPKNVTRVNTWQEIEDYVEKNFLQNPR